MKKEAVSLAFFISLFTITIIAEGQDTISVNKQLSQKREVDSVKAIRYYLIAQNYVSAGKADSGIMYINISSEIADGMNFYSILGANYELAATVFENNSDWEGSLQNWLRAASFYLRSNDKEGQSRIFRKIASRYFDQGIYKKSAWYTEQEFLLYSGDNIKSMALSSESAALSFYYLPNDSLGISWYEAASHFYEKLADTSGILRCAQKLAVLYVKIKSFTNAETYYNKLISAYLVKKDYRNAAIVLNNSGYLKFKNKNYTGAIDEFNSAAEYSSKAGTDSYFLTDVYSNIAICYQNLNSQKEMLENFKTALQYSKDSGRKNEEARLEHLLAIIYFKKGDNYHADLYCQECINSAKKSSDFSIMVDCYKTWSEVMEKGNDFVNALTYYERSLTIADSLNFQKKLSEQQEIERQAKYEVTEQRIRMDIADEEIKGLAFKNLKAEAATKENEIKLLQKQNDLDRSEKDRLAQSLALEQEKSLTRENQQRMKELEQEKQMKQWELALQKQQDSVLKKSNQLLEIENDQAKLKMEKENQRKKMLFWVVVLMVLVACSILYGLISSRRKNKKLEESKKEIEKINSELELKNREVLKQNEKIVQQKDIIEQKNQAITDSIQYASRIQTAVLPPENFLTDWGIDNFIYYRPKDIVSGDFYWGMKKGESIIVAAADCTGHGVPGAFMSMLGHALLDEVIASTEIADAASILNRLRDGIITTLKQKGMIGEARDGMDISLVIINRSEGKMDYAGANNPLYIIRDGKLLKYPADRMPIGIHFTTLSPFTNTTIDLRKGDYLYLFSDGFADQFGGNKGKKFMYKSFQDLLVRNHYKPMELQKDILDNTFIKWKGDRDQVDDVLVIGMHL